MVRDLLERATVPEPPIGPITQNALRAGIRLRRRRVQGIAAAAAVICAAAFVVTETTVNRSATPAAEPATVYVLGMTQNADTVTPIPTTTNRPGRPIVLESAVSGTGTQLAVTPNGKTIWVADGNAVTPISATTHTAGTLVRLASQRHGNFIQQLLITPDGKTLYVLDSTGRTGSLTAISPATHRPGRPIELGQAGAAGEMAITPNGKTLYVAVPGTPTSYVIPIALATGRPGKRITVPANVADIVVTPDGKTLYVISMTLAARSSQIEVTPIATATNRPDRPIIAGNGLLGVDVQAVMSPDGQTIFIPDALPSGVIPFSTATNTPGKLISLGAGQVRAITVAPDGSTAYVLSQPTGRLQRPHTTRGLLGLTCTGPPGDVTPITTATNTVRRPIKVGCSPYVAAFTPDGRTLYVGGLSASVTPITTATGRPGKPIKVDLPEAILIVPAPG